MSYHRELAELKTDHLKKPYTYDSLRNMPPSKELDEWVGVTIMGYEPTELRRVDHEDPTVVKMSRFKKGNRQVLMPAFSTDLVASFEIVEHLRKLGWKVKIEFPSGDIVSVTLEYKDDFGSRRGVAYRAFPRGYAVPEAIVKACVEVFCRI